MKIAFTISSYRLVSFVHLGIVQLKKLSPDSPILVSDDRSPESPEIEKIALELGCSYRCTRLRKGHFAGAFQSLVNGLVFAESHEATVAVILSQRLILRKVEAIDIIKSTFENENIMVATPGQPKVNSGGSAQGFGRFTTLSDIVMLRVGCMSAEELLHMYRARIIKEQMPWRAFIECTVDILHHTKFNGRTRKLEEFTNPGADPIYLRRYQSSEQQYRDLALSHGFNGMFTTVEWGGIEGRNYLSNPIVV